MGIEEFIQENLKRATKERVSQAFGEELKKLDIFFSSNKAAGKTYLDISQALSGVSINPSKLLKLGPFTRPGDFGRKEEVEKFKILELSHSLRTLALDTENESKRLWNSPAENLTSLKNIIQARDDKSEKENSITCFPKRATQFISQETKKRQDNAEITTTNLLKEILSFANESFKRGDKRPAILIPSIVEKLTGLEWIPFREKEFLGKLNSEGSTLPFGEGLFGVLGSLPGLATLSELATAKGEWSFEKRRREFQGTKEQEPYSPSAGTITLASIGIILPILSKAQPLVDAVRSGLSVGAAKEVKQIGTLIDGVLGSHRTTPFNKESLLKLVGAIKSIKTELATDPEVANKVYKLLLYSGRKQDAQDFATLAGMNPENLMKLSKESEAGFQLATDASHWTSGKRAIPFIQAKAYFLKLDTINDAVEVLKKSLAITTDKFEKTKLVLLLRNYAHFYDTPAEFRRLDIALHSLIQGDQKAEAFYSLEKSAQSLLANLSFREGLQSRLPIKTGQPTLTKISDFIESRAAELEILGNDDFYSAIEIGLRRTIPLQYQFELSKKSGFLAIYY